MSFFSIFYVHKRFKRDNIFFFFYSFSLFFKVRLSLKSVSNIFRNFSCVLACCLWRITIYNCCVCCLFHFFFLSFETFIRLSIKNVVYLDSCAHVWIWLFVGIFWWWPQIVIYSLTFFIKSNWRLKWKK